MISPSLTFHYDFGSGFSAGPPPLNAGATTIEAIWTSQFPSASVQSILYEFGGAIAKQITDYRDNGLSGGTGIGEGIGFRIYDNGNLLFDGCLDTANQSALWECDIVKLPLKETGKIDFVMSYAYITFNYLYSKGKITPAMFKNTPYTITQLPDLPQLLMLIISEFSMVIQLTKELNDLTKEIERLAGGATTEVASAGISSGDLIADIIIVVSECIFAALLLTSIILVSIQIFDQIVQKKKYKKCMRVEDIFKAVCSELNLNFSSTILAPGSIYRDLTIMPAKVLIPNTGTLWDAGLFKRSADEISNPLAYGHPDGSFKEWLEGMNTVFNAKIQVNGGVMIWEEEHAFNNPNLAYQLPNQGEQGFTHNYPDPHGTNLSELASNTELRFQLDSSETNTLHQYAGTSCQATITPINVHNEGNVLLQGLKSIEFPYALGNRKQSLTFVEQLLNTMFNAVTTAINDVITLLNGAINAVNTVISWFGGSSTTVPTIGLLPTDIMAGRIGYLELSNDAFSIPKMFIGYDDGGDWKVSPNNKTYLSAKALMDNFHGKNLATRGNQWKTYRGKKFKMCIDDFLLIKGKNIFTTADNKIGKFEKISYQFATGEATADYRINENYTNNLQEHISVDGI
jgi:hypothetical protein